MKIDVPDGVNAFGPVGCAAVKLIDDGGDTVYRREYGCMVLPYDTAFRRAPTAAAGLSRELGGAEIGTID